MFRLDETFLDSRPISYTWKLFPITNGSINIRSGGIRQFTMNTYNGMIDLLLIIIQSFDSVLKILWNSYRPYKSSVHTSCSVQLCKHLQTDLSIWLQKSMKTTNIIFSKNKNVCVAQHYENYFNYYTAYVVFIGTWMSTFNDLWFF